MIFKNKKAASTGNAGAAMSKEGYASLDSCPVRFLWSLVSLRVTMAYSVGDQTESFPPPCGDRERERGE